MNRWICTPCYVDLPGLESYNMGHFEKVCELCHTNKAAHLVNIPRKYLKELEDKKNGKL
jgi:hypothetical protein